MSIPGPDTKRAVGASQGTGAIHRLPFHHPDTSKRTGYYYIPANAPAKGRPVAVVFHGFLDYGYRACEMWRAFADTYKVALVGPDSGLVGPWDVGKANQATSDLAHAINCLYWLQQHAGHQDGDVSAVGHSYGCRMAAYFATNGQGAKRVAMAHGRSVPESLGGVHSSAFFSGCVTDNQFDYKVMEALAPKWPNGPHQLHAFGGNHAPQHDEVMAVGAFVAGS